MSDRVPTVITDPRLAEIHERHRRGEVEAAERDYRAYLSEKPNHAEAWHLMGLAQAARGDVQAGARSVQRAVELNGSEARYHNNLGHFFRMLGRPDDAVRELEQAVQLRPIFPGAHYNLGLALHELGRVEQAEQSMKKACAQDSGYIQAHYWLGLIRQDLGRLTSAVESFERAVELKPDYAPAIYQLAQGRRVSSEGDPLLLRVQSLTLGDSGSIEDRMLAHFALGKLLDDLGDYAAAADAYDEANRLYPGEFDGTALAARIDALREAFPADFFPTQQARGSSSSKPLFIVGMPRSGSTLINQIIAAHPRASSAGERVDLPILVGQLEKRQGETLTRWIGRVDEGALKSTATTYLSRITRAFPDSLRVIDKLPGNWQLLGVIALLFPRARIIVSEREARAVAWSCYSRKFDRGQTFSYDLEDIAVFYYQYRRLMNHWAGMLPVPMLTVRYEDLVENTEAVSRKLIEFCDLEWDEGCLRFFESSDVVTSASNRQVRQPVHRDSLEHWRHYARSLERFEARLQRLESESG